MQPKNTASFENYSSSSVNYVVCDHCARINIVHVEENVGVMLELHERGVCILRHPQALRGPYSNAAQATHELRRILNSQAPRESANELEADALAAVA